MTAAPRIIVVSGLPGAGKSTTARLLAGRLPRAAHVEGDRLQQLIVSGGVWPDARGGGSPEAEQQLGLRLRHACLLARSFAEHGFTAVVDDIVAGARFEEMAAHLDGVPYGFVMLFPVFEHVKARWRSMGSPFVDSWDWIDAEIRHRTPRVGLWLDTTGLTPEQTVETVLARLDETVVA